MMPIVAGAIRDRWAEVFAAGYDRMCAASERAGMEERRRAVLAGAEGVTVELGAGTGLNLPLYPEAVTELILTEPEAAMAEKLEERVRAEAGGRPVRVERAGAEALPLPDASADTVVGTLVLCTVPDVPAALAEVARVLRPGGRLLLIEHVGAHEGWQRTAQRVVHRPWRALACGCHTNRDAAAALRASPLEVEALHEEPWEKNALLSPLLVGSARASS